MLKRQNSLINQFNSSDHINFDLFERQLMLQGKILSNQNQNYDSIDDLGQVEFSVFSQWGEDGIIDWLVRKLPNIPKTFVEFGVENYQESNTRFLLQNHNWRALVIDGSKQNIDDIQAQDIYWRYSLSAHCSFVRKENINEILSEAGMQGEIGLLSIDIDGNDYWVWKAINIVHPAIVSIEYNAVFGDIYPLSIPYMPNFVRTEEHFSNLYFGASLASFIDLGRKKNYNFIGTTTSGVNAFFVRNDLFPVIKDLIHSFSTYPSKFRESRNESGKLTFLNGNSRFIPIGDMPLINTVSGEAITLRELNNIYSAPWTNGEKRVFNL